MISTRPPPGAGPTLPSASVFVLRSTTASGVASVLTASSMTDLTVTPTFSSGLPSLYFVVMRTRYPLFQSACSGVSKYSFVDISSLSGFFSFSVTVKPVLAAAAFTCVQMALNASSGVPLAFAESMRNLYSRPPTSSSFGAGYRAMVCS